MIFSLVCKGALPFPVWDDLVERVHACTPLLVVGAHGRLYSGTDNIDALRILVRTNSLHAALAPTRVSALLCALNSTPGRLDIYNGADDVPTATLLEISSLGLDERDIERLHLFGMCTIAHLHSLSERHLRAQFGSAGARIHALLHTASAPMSLYVPPPAVVARIRFEESQREPGIIESALADCIRRAVRELAPRLCSRIELAILDRTDEPCAHFGRILREGLSDPVALGVHVGALARALMAPTRWWWGIQLRLASLAPPAVIQTQLFLPRTSAHEITQTLLPRYASVIKRAEILNPWSIIPEQHARITGYSIDPAGNT